MKSVFVVYGDPIPLARHRACIRNGRINTYNSQRKEFDRFSDKVKSQLCSKFIPYNRPIDVNIFFYMPIPKSASAIKKIEMEDEFHSKKPDLSNLVKFVEDSLNGIVWEDDKLICMLSSQKLLSNAPRTVIEVRYAE